MGPSHLNSSLCLDTYRLWLPPNIPELACSTQQDQIPGSRLRVNRVQRNTQVKAKVPETKVRKGPPHLQAVALPLKRVEEEGPGSVSQSPWVAARRVYHMLLFSSRNPESAWQQAALAVFTAYLPTMTLSLPPPPVAATTQLPESQRAGGQATRMASTPSPTRTGLSWAHRACQAGND